MKQYTKKCKHCKEVFKPYTTLQKYCTKSDCTKVFVEIEKDKAWKKRKAVMNEDQKTIQYYVKQAQVSFNTFIRTRDKGLNCISCNKPCKKENAGHYYNANNHWSIRFNEDNVHLQCEHCNTHLSGNLIPYRDNLIKKIGLIKYYDIVKIANDTRHFTKDELKEIEKKYKLKCKELKY